MEYRAYKSYDAYLSHQRSKLGLMADLSEYDAQFSRALRLRLVQGGQIKEGMRVLCLGARLGTEVRAFQDLGCFAVGMDINPGRRNSYVVYGDFHHLTFPPRSTDVVYTNSFDHVLEPRRVLDEIRRVLAPQGVFILEALRGRREGQRPGFYESFFWTTIDDLVRFLEEQAFRLQDRRPVTYPWAGEHLSFRLSD